MKEVLREVWGLLDLKGCEWLNKKALFCRGEFTPGTESERSPREENGNPFQYSCLGNPMDRGALWAVVHSVKKSWM